MITFIKKVKKYIVLQVLFDLIGVCCLALTPLLQKYFFDNALGGGFEIVIKVSCLYFILHGVYAVSQYFCMLVAFKGGVKFEQNLKRSFFDSLFLRKDYQFRKKSIGDYISFQANDIIALEQDYLQPTIDLIKSLNMFLVYSLVLFIGIDWRIALVIIVSSFVSVVIPKVLGTKLENSRYIYQTELSKYVVKITDILEGFSLINSRTIGSIKHRHSQSLQTVSEKRYQFGKVKSFTLFVSLFLTKMVKVITFVTIITLYYKQEITIGTGIATLSYVSSLLEPIDNILYDVTTIQSVKKIREKFIHFINYKPSQTEKLSNLNSDIVLKDVSYQYAEFAVKNINSTFPA